MIDFGIDTFIFNMDSYSLYAKKIGLITNCTGISKSGISTIDLLKDSVDLVKLFAPEHGIRGEFQAGDVFESYIDKKTGLPVVSLYGKNRKPTKEMLDDIDILIFDIQDVGTRFYTYLYTMAYAMESCAQFDKKMIVLDRPNPINANSVEGNILDIKFRSFIGYYPIPQRYGLTIGEAAALFNKEFEINSDLTVVPMSNNYSRDMYYENTGNIWVLPSPNIPSPETCLLYPVTCIFEGTNISEGRGTTKPFHFIGAPFISATLLADETNALKLPGVFFRPHYFTPTFSKYKDCLCNGVEIHITDKNSFMPVRTGTILLYKIKELFKEFEFLPPINEGGRAMIDLNTGSNKVKNSFELSELLSNYDKDSKEFCLIKEKYHLYN